MNCGLKLRVERLIATLSMVLIGLCILDHVQEQYEITTPVIWLNLLGTTYIGDQISRKCVFNNNIYFIDTLNL